VSWLTKKMADVGPANIHIALAPFLEANQQLDLKMNESLEYHLVP